MADTKDYVANELGHTSYPKMIYPDGNEAGKGVVVESPEHEAEVTGAKPEDKKPKDKPPGWK